ncbi:MAG: antibiotic biosynthesis monooxygenase [Mycobacterium sp.]
MMPQVDDAELFMSNTLVIRPEWRSAYLRELMTVLPQARALDGCQLLEVGEIVDTPGTFVLTERWRSGLEYVNEYLALPFYQNYLKRTEDMYAGPRKVVVLSSIGTTH